MPDSPPDMVTTPCGVVTILATSNIRSTASIPDKSNASCRSQAAVGSSESAIAATRFLGSSGFMNH